MRRRSRCGFPMLPKARALQRTWDSVINPRAALQGLAVLSLFVRAVAG
ncbi:hypothetical protein ACFXPS_39285 [Nocardia sp. NPDC059091]